MIYLGFDTSNYTSSVAAVDDKYKNIRKILDVQHGMRGLRQSDALFLHIKNMPLLYNKLSLQTDFSKVSAVGVSTRPRNVEGSYMPVFLAGIMQAKSVADTLGVPLCEFSHQDGHIMSGVISSGFEISEEEFLSVHLSGGTSEILKTRYNGYNFDCEIIGGTKDISAGQVIDRIGVAAGLDFPSGKELDRLSTMTKQYIKLPVSVDGGFFNFSGMEAKGVEKAGKEELPSLALGIFYGIAETLLKAIDNCKKVTGIKKVLIVGGVASNSIIRKKLSEQGDVFFASSELSSDNAVGIAYCTKYAERGNR